MFRSLDDLKGYPVVKISNGASENPAGGDSSGRTSLESVCINDVRLEYHSADGSYGYFDCDEFQDLIISFFNCPKPLHGYIESVSFDSASGLAYIVYNHGSRDLKNPLEAAKVFLAYERKRRPPNVDGSRRRSFYCKEIDFMEEAG